jgi:hypothetical protein
MRAFTEYAILAFWAIRAFSGSSVGFLRDQRFWLAVLLVILVTSTDEYHQSFEPSRTSSIYDVLLDCTGGAYPIPNKKLISAALYSLIYRSTFICATCITYQNLKF